MLLITTQTKEYGLFLIKGRQRKRITVISLKWLQKVIYMVILLPNTH